jgi:hypothetical protein
MSLTLEQTNFPCLFLHTFCGEACGTEIEVFYNPSGIPAVSFRGLTLVPPAAVTDCDDFSFIATNGAGITATVSPAGNYDPANNNASGGANCAPCCRDGGTPPEEVEIEVRQLDAEGNWVPPSPLEEVPTFVLAWDGSCQSEWRAFVGGAISQINNIGVDVAPCKDGDKCDECIKKCETLGWIDWSANRVSAYSKRCADCKTSPVCSPEAGEYIIERSNLPTLKITVT